MDPFRYPRTPRSRSLKPLVFPDLLGKAQDGQNHPQARKRRKVLKTVLHVICHCCCAAACQLIFKTPEINLFFFYSFIITRHSKLYFTHSSFSFNGHICEMV